MKTALLATGLILKAWLQRQAVILLLQYQALPVKKLGEAILTKDREGRQLNSANCCSDSIWPPGGDKTMETLFYLQSSGGVFL